MQNWGTQMSFFPTTSYAKAKVMPSKICGSDFFWRKGQRKRDISTTKSAVGNSCKRSLTSEHFGAVLSAPQNYNTSQKTTNISVMSRTNIPPSPICSNLSSYTSSQHIRILAATAWAFMLPGFFKIQALTSLTSWQHYCLQPLSSLMEYVIAVWKYGY